MARSPAPQDPVPAIRALLEGLNLTTAARQLGELLAQAETAQPAYSEFLRQLLETEEGARWNRKIQRRRRWSKLGPPTSLEGFDWSARPQLAPQVVKELLTGRFIDERRNVILVGRPSTGKTTVAKALGEAACAQARSVYYGTMDDVLQTLHASRADGTYRKTFRRITTPALLILDDAGFTELPREAAHELFRLVCERHRQRSTIVVTNLPFKQWGEFLPSRPGRGHRRPLGGRRHDPPLHRRALPQAARHPRSTARGRVAHPPLSAAAGRRDLSHGKGPPAGTLSTRSPRPAGRPPPLRAENPPRIPPPIKTLPQSPPPLRRRLSPSPAVTAKAFVVSKGTLLRWLEALKKPGQRLVAGCSLVRRLPDLVHEVAALLRFDQPEWGTRRIAHVLARLGLKVSRTSVQRILQKRRPSRPRQAPAPVLRRVREGIRPRGPHHVWFVDLTTVKSLFGLVTVHIGAVVDAFSRSVLAVAVHPGSRPPSGSADSCEKR